MNPILIPRWQHMDYIAYIVDSRSFKQNKDGRPIWTHKVLDAAHFTNKEKLKSWARKHKGFSLDCYVYLEGENKLYEYFNISHGTINYRGFPFPEFKNNRPQFF